MKHAPNAQRGVMLLEALLGILIFSLGILALIGLQSASVSAAAESQYRVEAVNLANQLLSRLWTSVDRTSAATMQASLLSFNHRTTGSSDSCDFAGGDSTNAQVVEWANLVNHGDAAGSGSQPLLPGASANRQQVVVNTGLNNQVTITVCWQSPSDNTTRRHILVANVN